MSGLKAIINYIKDESKTMDFELVANKDLLKGDEFQQMLLTKEMHNKTSGRQYAHFVQSFHPNDNVTPQIALEISQEFIKRNDKFNDFQVVSAVHTNEKHMHIHYVVNSVSTEQGSKWQCSPKDLLQMRNISDDLCRENGLSVIEERKKYSRDTSEHCYEKQLAIDIAECLDSSFFFEMFTDKLEERNIECYRLGDELVFETGVGYCGQDSERICYTTELMEYGDYSEENILNTLDYREFCKEEGSKSIYSTTGPLIEAMAQLDIFDGMSNSQVVDTVIGVSDLEGKTWLEIQAIMAKIQEIIRNKKFTQDMIDRVQKNQQNTKLLLTSLCGLCEEFQKWLEQKRENDNCYRHYHEEEIEFER